MMSEDKAKDLVLIKCDNGVKWIDPDDLAELEADRKRLEWLESHPLWINGIQNTASEFWFNVTKAATYPTFRKAIDAAMKESENADPG